jgi:hypothetical protein
MASSTVSKISKETLDRITPEEVQALAERLETDNYASPFESLQDWHLLRAIAMQRSELAEPYVHLLDNEEFDEA